MEEEKKSMSWESLLCPQRLGKPSLAQSNTNLRTPFDQDYDRIIFSHPFRSLQDKTQVFPLPDSDFVHNRLTHSLEVSSVGRSLGRSVGEAVLEAADGLKHKGFTAHDFGAIVAAACLAHDIGNPPFGHAGESTISSFFSDSKAGQFFRDKVKENEWKDLVSFEGNAQGFRLLNDPDNRGLHCTAATLAAFTKYPRSSNAQKIDGRKSQKKYGFCQSNIREFEDVAALTGLLPLGSESWCRHPLAYLVEAADDICYLIIDLEDATQLGLVSFEQTRTLLASIIGERYSEEKLEQIEGNQQKVATLRAMAIYQLIADCSKIFLQNEADILIGGFDKSLTSQLPYAKTIKEISALSVAQIYQSRQVIEREALGLSVLSSLTASFTQAMYYSVFDKKNKMPIHETHYRLLPNAVKNKLDRADITLYQSLQWVLDFISGLTDRSAIRMHKLLTGQVSVL
jgi:dGTPase